MGCGCMLGMRLDEWGTYKVVRSRRALGLGKWRVKGCVMQGDVRVSGSKLRMRVLVFDGMGAAARWGRGFRYKVNVPGCDGFYLDCSKGVDSDGEADWYECDPVYWGVMGLQLEALGGMGIELVAHEAVHAAVGYAWRTRCSVKWPSVDISREEYLAYPVGIITGGVMGLLGDAGLV